MIERAQKKKWSTYANDLNKTRNTEKGRLQRYRIDLGEVYRFSDSGELERHRAEEWTFTTPASQLKPETIKEIERGDDVLEDIEIPASMADRLIELADYETDEPGNDGTRWTEGVAYRGENDNYDYPVTWRGLGIDYGKAHQIYLSSPVYQRPVASITQAIVTGQWSMRGPKKEANTIKAAQDALDGLEGGLMRFLVEAAYSLTVPGWGIWIRVHHPDGRLKRLAYRRSNTLNRVILDEAEQRILAFEFLDSSDDPYTVDAKDCLVITLNRLGNDIEGLSPLRSVAEYIRAKQELLSIMMAGLELNATGLPVVEATGEYRPDENDAGAVASAITNRRAGKAQAAILPKGLVAKDLTPQSFPPTAQALLEYYDKMISMPLSSEGALIGQGNHGSFALVNVKDDQQLRVAVFLAILIQDALNGVDNSPTTGVIATMLEAMGLGGKGLSLEFSLGESEVAIEDIITAVQAGLVEVTPALINYVTDRLKLPKADEAESGDEEGPVGVELETGGAGLPAQDVQKTALNGAQFKQLFATIAEVSAGIIPKQAAILALQIALPTLDPAQAGALIEAASGGAGNQPPPEEGELEAMAMSDVIPFWLERRTIELNDDEAIDLFDVDGAKKAHTKAEQIVGSKFQALAKAFRRAWVEATKGVSGVELMDIREDMRGEWLPQFREAALEPINELRAKGGLSIAAEVGAIAKVPARISDAPATAKTIQMADALALKSYNITESAMLEQSARELNGMPEAAFPDLPTKSAYEKHAASVIPGAFTQGRDEVVAELVEESRRRPDATDRRIVAEYSSVLEGSTCAPCRDLDGRRFVVGSEAYEKYKPISVCLGRGRCRCIMSYLGNEEDLAGILDDLDRGFSQVTSPIKKALGGGTVQFSDNVGPLTVIGPLLNAYQSSLEGDNVSQDE